MACASRGTRSCAASCCLTIGRVIRCAEPSRSALSPSTLRLPGMCMAHADTRELLTVNMGPQHPSTHGVLRLELQLDGEVVVHCRPVIGYLHTGIEKTFETKTYVQCVVLTDRMDYLNPLGNNL